MDALEPPISIPPACPGNWNYENFPGYKQAMQPRLAGLLLALWRAVPIEQLEAAKDTRSIHGMLFEGLTFPDFGYYAGNYRGSKLWCLDIYRVQVPADPRVGHDPAIVPMEMESFSERIEQAIRLIDRLMNLNAGLGEPAKLVAYVQTVAAIFVEFLEIHPYANGNGHMGRFIVLALLARRKIRPTNAWPIDPRPADPPYSNLITRYRNGDRDPLVQFIIDAL